MLTFCVRTDLGEAGSVFSAFSYRIGSVVIKNSSSVYFILNGRRVFTYNEGYKKTEQYENSSCIFTHNVLT